MIRITADTTVLVCGLTFADGNARTLLELARAGAIELAISDVVLDQLTDVLRSKFEWPDTDLREVRRQFMRFFRHVAPETTVHAVVEDPDDNAVLECAAAAASEFIVSGDRHLLQLGAFRGVRVMKVAAFLEHHASLE